MTYLYSRLLFHRGRPSENLREQGTTERVHDPCDPDPPHIPVPHLAEHLERVVQRQAPPAHPAARPQLPSAGQQETGGQDALRGRAGVLHLLDAALRGQHLVSAQLRQRQTPHDPATENDIFSPSLHVVLHTPHHLLLHEQAIQTELRGRLPVLLTRKASGRNVLQRSLKRQRRVGKSRWATTGWSKHSNHLEKTAVKLDSDWLFSETCLL